MNRQNEHGKHWWLGVADLMGHGLYHGSEKLERVHLSIAEESFRVLDRIPVTRPWSRSVREVHHGVSRLSYRSIALAARSLVRLGEERFRKGHQGTD